MYVVIVGGGKVGYYLSRELLKEKHEVLLLEKDKRRLDFLGKDLSDIVQLGDGCEIRQMESAGFGRADVVVAVTGDDEDNLVICQMARNRFGVKRVLARVNDPANEALFHKLGVEETLNSTRIIYNLLEQSIETDEVVPLAALPRDREIAQIHVGLTSAAVGKRITDLGLPERSLVLVILRNGDAHLPTFDTRIAAEDTVVLLSTEDESEKLSQIFAS